jgi:hypothetical protein
MYLSNLIQACAADAQCDSSLQQSSQAEPHPQLRAADALLQSPFQQSQRRPRLVHLWDPAILSLVDAEICFPTRLPHDPLFPQSTKKLIGSV